MLPAMKTLLVLRHAKASQDATIASDHTRPLTKKGRKAARRIGELLVAEQLVPDLVLSSTAARARETTEVVVESSGHSGPITFLDELYLAEAAAYFDALQRLGGQAERVLVVGHNPGLEALVQRLTGAAEHMPTAALAECALPLQTWSELRADSTGNLTRLFRPKELDP